MTNATTLEEAKQRHHKAAARFHDLDARLIDAKAGLEELTSEHGKACDELNAARIALIDARAPQRVADGEKPQSVEGALAAVERLDTDCLNTAADGIQGAASTVVEAANAAFDRQDGQFRQRADGSQFSPGS
jgi:hypothetical protein